VDKLSVIVTECNATLYYLSAESSKVDEHFLHSDLSDDIR